MRRPGAVCFHAALRASHGACRLRNVQFLPVTHEESLALTLRQLGKLLFNYFNNLCPFQPVRRGISRLEAPASCKVSSGSWSSSSPRPGARLEISVVTASAPSAPEPIAYRVLQDALEQGRQLAGVAVAVALREAQHRVLHDVERRLIVADREQRLLEGAPFDAREERRQFTARCQFFSSEPDPRPLRTWYQTALGGEPGLA